MKWYGTIGYAETKETSPGIWEEQITERNTFGDMLSYSRRMQGSSSVNDNISINNTLSIIADDQIVSHYQYIRYVEFMGAKWKVSSVEFEYPRLKLSLGELYNG